MQCKSSADFPWAGSHPWDVDIAIVGAGPAGLSAAIRLRWLKTMPPLPLSTCLINSGSLGGLARLGNSILTSPGLAFPAGELVKRLERDLQKWPLPILSGKVIAVEHRQDHFRLILEDGRELSAVAVIMACGMMDTRNIADFWRQGVVATFGNRENIFTILRKELANCSAPLILGGPHLTKLRKTITDLNPHATLLVPPSGKSMADGEGRVIAAELIEIREKEGILSSVILKSAQGITERTVDRVIVEFNSIELERSQLPRGIAGQTNGYMETTGPCQSGTPGLFAAGDCTGPPFAALIALGQGAEAAFAAYRFVHGIKYGKEPALFAYFGDLEVSDGLTDKNDFPVHREMIPAKLVHHCPLTHLQALWTTIDGHKSIAALSQENSLSDDEISLHLKALIKERSLTFCPYQ